MISERGRDVHRLNTLPAAQVAELAASTPAHVTEAFGAHRRFFPDPGLDPFHFSSIPNRLDGGIDTQWGSPRHRVAVRLRCRLVSLRDRRAGTPQPVYGRGPVNGAFRGLVVGLLLELAAVGVIAGFVIVRKVY